MAARGYARGYARARKESRPVARVLSQRGELPGWDMSAARWPQSRVGVGADYTRFFCSLPPPCALGTHGGKPGPYVSCHIHDCRACFYRLNWIKRAPHSRGQSTLLPGGGARAAGGRRPGSAARHSPELRSPDRCPHTTHVQVRITQLYTCDASACRRHRDSSRS